MPTLTRFITIILIVAAAIYAGAFALANFVRPTQVEKRIELPIQDLMERAEQRQLANRPRTPLPERNAEPDAAEQDETQ
ncbi:hypothetical protein [Notoacmeibacter ruber]|uniref:hypothetical protein n=1 Tax=Notoacmeibacter ruber TaxID=2670375 RepID=UPI0018F4D393|nr:hypothetical protein [Notoacmeibacter ruber]